MDSCVFEAGDVFLLVSWAGRGCMSAEVRLPADKNAYFYITFNNNNIINLYASYRGGIILSSFPQFHNAGVQGDVFLLQNLYTNAVCLQLLLHIQKHVSCSLKIYNEQHVATAWLQYSKNR